MASFLRELRKPGNFMGSVLLSTGMLLAMVVLGAIRFHMRCASWTLDTLLVAMISVTWGMALVTIQEYHFLEKTDRTTRFLASVGMVITACTISANLVYRRQAEHACVELYQGHIELRDLMVICLFSALCVRLSALVEPVVHWIMRSTNANPAPVAVVARRPHVA